MYSERKIIEKIFLVVSISLALIFALWWFNPHHLPHNFRGYASVIDLLLFLAVSYIIWHPIMMEMLTWAISSHIKSNPFHTPVPGLKVAFITTIVPSKESIDLLHKCLPSMVRATYKHDTWLLDEENNDEVKKICEQYGVKHYSRYGVNHYNLIKGKYARHTKGGNHNSWYEEHGNRYDFVAQIDTDYVARKSFLVRTIGYFRDPKVAFVGTPQIYTNISNSIIARGAGEQAYNFYGTILRGLSGMGMSLLIGANHVVRVSALKSIDHYSAHITEDLLTGMKFHSKGWKSIYVPYPLAYGEGPETWKSYFNQQMRWAYGSMDILFHHSPKLFWKMGFRQSAYYFLLQQHYFSGFITALSILLLGFYFAFGIVDADLEFLPFVIFYGSTVISCMAMSFWLQHYHVRQEEKGFLSAGKIVSIASWPIYFLAFVSAVLGKRLKYAVTPKGVKASNSENSLSLFTPHIVFGLITLSYAISAFFTQRNDALMIYWALITSAFMFLIPFSHIIVPRFFKMIHDFKVYIDGVYKHNLYLEFNAKKKLVLPQPPNNKEKYIYINNNAGWVTIFSLFSFTGVSLSMFLFLQSNPLMWPLYFYFGLTIIYFTISLILSSYKSFDLVAHNKIVDKWRDIVRITSVDIFIPTAGEDLAVLNNTFSGIYELVRYYGGYIKVYSLDDSGRQEVRELAEKYNFYYNSRPNRGEFKKAGNLRHGFSISHSDFIAIFDADFKPRRDMLYEMLPYFFENEKMGIVQSPQYFDVRSEQNWLERGAGAVQEFFYKYSQVIRQNNDAAICVGTNALYRRVALDEIGGTALIEHSEDVHTGFNLRIKGWTIQYIPIILAKGLCPSEMNAFFKQQYRWCKGSMSLLTSKKFWGLKMSSKARLSYISGFLYYIHTAVSSLMVPFIPLSLILFYPHQVSLVNYLLIVPSIIFMLIIYPIWHIATYGVEAWATRLIYGWAHLFAILDTIFKKSMAWHATGVKIKRDNRYISFRWLQYIFNVIPAFLWVALSLKNIIVFGNMNFIPVLIGGIYFLFISLKVAVYVNTEKN